jgi:hypothetical protein
MRCDSRASFLARTFASPRLGCEPKARVTTLRVEGCVGAPKWGLGRVISESIIHTNLHKPNNKLVSVWLELFWCTNKPLTFTDSQNSPRLGLGETTTFPFIVFFFINHEGCIQMSFFLGTLKLKVSKFLELGLSTLWKVVIFCASLQLKWGFKKNCNLCREFFNDTWHATYMHLFYGDSQLLVGRSQIDTLIPELSFCHNLCFKYSNESYEPILDIYVSKSFQWYKELFDLMSFDPWNTYLGFHRDSNSQNGSPLGSVWVHFLTLSGVQMWLSGCTFGLHLSMPLPWSQAQG